MNEKVFENLLNNPHLIQLLQSSEFEMSNSLMVYLSKNLRDEPLLKSFIARKEINKVILESLTIHPFLYAEIFDKAKSFNSSEEIANKLLAKGSCPPAFIEKIITDKSLRLTPENIERLLAYQNDFDALEDKLYLLQNGQPALSNLQLLLDPEKLKNTNQYAILKLLRNYPVSIFQQYVIEACSYPLVIETLCKESVNDACIDTLLNHLKPTQEIELSYLLKNEHLTQAQLIQISDMNISERLMAEILTSRFLHDTVFENFLKNPHLFRLLQLLEYEVNYDLINYIAEHCKDEEILQALINRHNIEANTLRYVIDRTEISEDLHFNALQRLIASTPSRVKESDIYELIIKEKLTLRQIIETFTADFSLRIVLAWIDQFIGVIKIGISEKITSNRFIFFTTIPQDQKEARLHHLLDNLNLSIVNNDYDEINTNFTKLCQVACKNVMR